MAKTKARARRKKPTYKGRRILHFVRHGQYQFEGDWGVRGGPLTPVGRRQAAAVAKYLARFPVARLHSSDSHRARETAEIISGALDGMKTRVSPLLREAMVAPVPVWPRKWQWDAKQSRRARRHFRKIMDRYMKPARSTIQEVVVCHGNLIRSLVMLALDAEPLGAWTRIDTYNCAVTSIAVNGNGTCQLMTVNERGFLPWKLRTST